MKLACQRLWVSTPPAPPISMLGSRVHVSALAKFCPGKRLPAKSPDKRKDINIEIGGHGGTSPTSSDQHIYLQTSVLRQLWADALLCCCAAVVFLCGCYFAVQCLCCHVAVMLCCCLGVLLCCAVDVSLVVFNLNQHETNTTQTSNFDSPRSSLACLLFCLMDGRKDDRHKDAGEARKERWTDMRAARSGEWMDGSSGTDIETAGRTMVRLAETTKGGDGGDDEEDMIAIIVCVR
jgi:hypothetical protein